MLCSVKCCPSLNLKGWIINLVTFGGDHLAVGHRHHFAVILVVAVLLKTVGRETQRVKTHAHRRFVTGFKIKLRKLIQSKQGPTPFSLPHYKITCPNLTSN